MLFSAAPGVAASEPTGPISASEAPDATPPEPAPPQPPAVADPIPLLIHLYRAEDFQGVRTESLRRQLDAPPSPVLQAELRYMEALARLALGEADAAMVDLDALRQQADAPPVAELAQLALAEAWLTQFPVQGVRMYQDYLAAHADSPWASPAAQRAAWGLAESGRFSMALTQLEGAGQPISPALRQTLTAPPRWKRPVLAAALSGALPGAGQLYARQPREALSAFAVNAVFFSGMALAARQRAWPAFGIAAFFGVGFYAGNIYGAADAALRYNRGARDDVMRTFEEELPPVEMPPLPQR
ncbi:MAG: hypothetical protein H6739_07235 [Alphaproteobacteria bacterium]|nr:hypothetical protein [Alphaproteobacteria bacterium]